MEHRDFSLVFVGIFAVFPGHVVASHIGSEIWIHNAKDDDFLFRDVDIGQVVAARALSTGRRQKIRLGYKETEAVGSGFALAKLLLFFFICLPGVRDLVTKAIVISRTQCLGKLVGHRVVFIVIILRLNQLNQPSL